MRTRTRNRLPAAPAGREGWPWVHDTPRYTERMEDGSPWPRVTVVTPSYNQAKFLEETLRSVLLQGYPELEYMVIDGGSSDGSVEIIRKYEDWLSFWISEADRGQSHAINKGWSRSSGEILAWLNSDDIQYPGAIRQAVTALHRNPDAAVVYGNCRYVDANGEHLVVRRPGPIGFEELLERLASSIPQPATFVRKSAIEEVGLLDEDLHYSMDYELWLRICMSRRMCYVDSVWAALRMHDDAKTVSSQADVWHGKKAVLDKIFASPQLPGHVYERRSEIYSRYYLKLSRILFSDLSWGRALHSLLKSVASHPRAWAGTDRWRKLARTFWQLFRSGPSRRYWPTA